MNKINFKHITISFVSFFGVSFLNAQNTTVKRDSTGIDVTYFKDHFKDAYSGDDFNYSINDTGGINLVQRILRKFFNWLGNLFGVDIDFIDYKTLEYIIYALLGLIILYLLIRFLIQNPVNSVFKTEAKIIDGFNYIKEDIEQVDFDKLIKNSLKTNNYRLATRYLYLKSLKVLSAKKIIEWHYDKTNSDYLNEIKDQKLKKLFKRASHIYDYVWYGKFPVNETSYNKNKDNFIKLIKVTQYG